MTSFVYCSTGAVIAFKSHVTKAERVSEIVRRAEGTAAW